MTQDPSTDDWMRASVRDALVRAHVSGSTHGLTILLQRGTVVVGLTVYGAWRVHRDGTLLAISGTDASVAEGLLPHMVGKNVVGAEVSGPFHDLRIAFEDGTTVEVWCDSTDHETWNLTGKGLDWFIGGPGHLWSHFDPMP